MENKQNKLKIISVVLYAYDSDFPLHRYIFLNGFTIILISQYIRLQIKH